MNLFPHLPMFHRLPFASVTDGLVERGSIFEHVADSGGVVLGVLLLLIALSVICWFVIGLKAVAIGRAIRSSRSFVQTFRDATRLAQLYDCLLYTSPSPRDRG